MILTKEINVKVSNSSKAYYQELLNIAKLKQGDVIILSFNLIKNETKFKVHVKCDNCENENIIHYVSYLDNIKNGNFYTCKNCSYIKRELTNLKLYNVKNCFQSSEKKQLIKNYYQEHFNCSHNMQIESCKDKRKLTYIKNYGCDNPSKNEDIKHKKEQHKFIKHKYNDTVLYYESSFEKHFLDNYYNKFLISRAKTIKYSLNEQDLLYFPVFFYQRIKFNN